jgi:hypothetical protein
MSTILSEVGEQLKAVVSLTDRVLLTTASARCQNAYIAIAAFIDDIRSRRGERPPSADAVEKVSVATRQVL